MSSIRRQGQSALAAAIVAVLFTGAGTVALGWASAEERPAEVAEDSPVLTGVSYDLPPVARPVVQVEAPVPQPEPAPLDARAATPVIQHGLLEIPAIGVSQTLFEGVTLTAIDRGPSHWPGTAMPGQRGNVVVAGHRTTHSRPFTDLDRLRPGDELIFTMNSGERFVYVHDGTQIVDDEAMYIVDQTPAYTATLFACHPKGSARQRIVAHFTLRQTAPTPATGTAIGSLGDQGP